MSFLALAAAADLPNPAALSPVERLVCMALAHYHNRRTGRCFPSQPTIAGRMNVSERSVREAINYLAEKGLIEVIKGGGASVGGRRSDAYRLLFADAYAKAQPQIAEALAVVDFPAMTAGIQKPDIPANRADFPAPTAGEPLLTSSKKNPPKSPKGKPDLSGNGDAVRDAAMQIKAGAPGLARTRSTVDEIATALGAAIKRGGAADQITVALRAYYAGDAAREDGRYAKAPHRMIEQDRWREWIPDDPPPGSIAPKAPPPPDAIAMALHLERVWKQQYGPQPVHPGCLAPPEILARFEDQGALAQ